MPKRNWIVLIIVAILVTGSIVFSSSAPIAAKAVEIEKVGTPTCCKQNTGECTQQKKETDASGEMIIDNLSRQFISVPVFSY
jgi:hypothetical protein